MEIDILKTFSSLIVNLKSIEIINLLYSSKNIDTVLKFNFTFKNEDVVFYYINFIKTIMTKYENLPLALFYNRQKLDFPIFT